jgi:hypothetical protein
MIFSKDILYVHVPKTGGMSVTQYLLEVLPRPVYYTHPNIDEERISNGVVQIPGRRHESLEEAQRVVHEYGFDISRLPLILAVLRNPFSLEVSLYAYLRAAHPWDAGARQQLALTKGFEAFVTADGCREAPWIRSGRSYEFRLYKGGEGEGGEPLAAVEVRCGGGGEERKTTKQDRIPTDGQPFVMAEPNPVPSGEGLGKTTITWATGDGSSGKVYVSQEGRPRRLFSSPHDDSLAKELRGYFFLKGRFPSNLHIAKFENLAEDIREALRKAGIANTTDFPWENRSQHTDFFSYYTKAAEETVYRKYKWVFDHGFYERL